MTILRTYHNPDHSSTELNADLGSTSWITDRNGDAIQYLHYLPLKSFAFFPPWRSVKEINFLYAHCLRRFGEEWIDQRSTSWNAQYSFTGKIKDAETGYNYFGARYYDSGLSVWLSVDPLSDKYPSMSPYTYCANNPVMLVDPDGREPIDPRTGAQYNINFYVATMYQPLPDDIPNPVFDKSLWEQATPFFERSFNKPDGLYDGISFISRGSSSMSLS